MIEDEIKLYLIKCVGMQTSVCGAPHGNAYVLDSNPTEAYNKLRLYLDENKCGFIGDRELFSVTLTADSSNKGRMRIHL